MTFGEIPGEQHLPIAVEKADVSVGVPRRVNGGQLEPGYVRDQFAVPQIPVGQPGQHHGDGDLLDLDPGLDVLGRGAHPL